MVDSQINKIGGKGMNFYQINLEETIRAIGCLAKKNGIITVRKIRRENNIKPSNRSKINFIWRALKDLVTQNVLKCINRNSPIMYRLTSSGKNFITNFNLKRNN